MTYEAHVYCFINEENIVSYMKPI